MLLYIRRSISLLLASLAALALFGSTASASTNASHRPVSNRDLQPIRVATAKYHNIATALGGAPLTLRLDTRPIQAPTPTAVDYVDVDTDAHTKTITLKGHVPFQDQKIAAGRIAAEKASTGYSVRNELVVK